MKKCWVNKPDSFEQAKEFDKNYYLPMSSKERLETMQSLREIYLNW
jgi:hypothetical protein